jgi:aldehyde dehydrogenase (NAD+)
MSQTITKREGEAAALAAGGKSAALDFGSAWDYAPAPEAADHVRIDPKYGLFIGGR